MKSFGLLAAVMLAGGCGPAAAPSPRAAETVPAGAAAFSTDDASWGKIHSRRFFVTVPVPDRRGWRVDDQSRPALYGVHDATSSKLWILATQESELMNRQKCEARARELGWVPSSLTTVEDQVTIGPDAYDSRVWVAVEAGKPGGPIEGHVYLFGAYIRRCLLVHVASRVASVKDDDALSARLAVVRGRMVRGITLDAPRVSDDAAIPRDKPEIRR